MRIDVNERLYLSEFRPADRAALVRHLNDRNIYERTLRLPFPYTEADADAWLGLVEKWNSQAGHPVQWAIREADGSLIGGCGFNGLTAGDHRGELGYWLATPFWGQGIMSAVVPHVCRVGFQEIGLLKIMAHVFVFNPASARVLEKCGFVREGLSRQHFLKDGRPIDVWWYGLLKDDGVTSI